MICEAAHVHYQVVIAERRPALGEQDIVVPGGRHFVRGVADIVGRNELALLDVHGAAGATRGDEQIGLAAEKSGDLEDVHGFGGGFGLRRLVDVGEDSIAIALEIGEDAKAFCRPRPAIGFDAAAVGFVERGFEDERAGDLANFGGEKTDVLLAFDHAGTGDQNQRLAAANRRKITQSACVNCSERVRCADFGRLLRCLCAAPMKAENNGCGSMGFDLNSGWNWQPRNQG